MKKSEIVRDAAEQVYRIGQDQRVCYCTPSREMVFRLEKSAQNNLCPFKQTVVDEMKETVARNLRKATGRTEQGEDLEEFDTEDTDAAYSLTDRIVERAFEDAAQLYEKHGD